MMCMNMVQNFFSSFDEEFTVHIPSLNKTVQTPIENVFPLGEYLLCLVDPRYSEIEGTDQNLHCKRSFTKSESGKCSTIIMIRVNFRGCFL